MSRRARPTRDRGSIAVLSMIVLLVAAALVYGVARVGVAAVLRTRAENAADAAALAAADALALGRTSGEARDAAVATARANGATLLQCECAEFVAEVAVELDVNIPLLGFPAVEARARAEIDLAES